MNLPTNFGPNAETELRSDIQLRGGPLSGDDFAAVQQWLREWPAHALAVGCGLAEVKDINRV